MTGRTLEEAFDYIFEGEDALTLNSIEYLLEHEDAAALFRRERIAREIAAGKWDEFTDEQRWYCHHLVPTIESVFDRWRREAEQDSKVGKMTLRCGAIVLSALFEVKQCICPCGPCQSRQCTTCENR